MILTLLFLQMMKNIVWQHNMNIKIIGNKIRKVSLTPTSNVAKIDINERDASQDMKTEINFGFLPEFVKNNEYHIVFHLNFSHREGVDLDLHYEATFETDKDIDEKFRESPFVFVNSPAIAYPFLRAYVSNLFLSSGYSPLMLPTVNFQKLFIDKKNEINDRKTDVVE